MTQEAKKGSVAYLPFQTFVTALDQLRGHGLPNKIDHSVFPSFSGVSRSQVLSAFRFFSLINEAGSPQPLLVSLVNEQDQRKALVKKLLETNYGEIIEQDLARIAPSQLDQAFSSEKYSVTGDTKQKARAFFLKAAEFAGMPISPLLKKRARAARGARTRRAATTNGQSNDDSSPTTTGRNGQASKPPFANSTPATGTTKTIPLSNAGSLTLAIDVNLWELKGKDRDFVFSLMDQIDAYEKRGAEGSTVAA